MAKLSTTLSFAGNAETVATNPGPFSMAISATTADILSVDLAECLIIETSDTLNANANGDNGPLDGSALATLSGADSDGNDNVTAGTVGGFLYLKNNSATPGENIFIGIVSSTINSGDPQAPSAPAASGTTALDNDTHDTLRTMTLLPGEFAWFPWDYTGDLNWEAATGTPQLEIWRFDRSA